MALHSGAIQHKAKVFQPQTKFRTSCRPFSQSLQVVKLPWQHIKSLLKFLSHKLKIHSFNSTAHGINTRNKPQLHKRAVHRTLYQKGVVYYLSIKICNELPEYTAVLVVDRKRLISTLKKYLINKLFYSLEEFINH